MSGRVVAIALAPGRRDDLIDEHDLERLEQLAAVEIETFVGLDPGIQGTTSNADAQRRLAQLAARADALLVAPGSPHVDVAILEAAPRLRFVGELEGDRFYTRIDVAAAQERGVTVVDTTHGSSYPVAEWALALAIIGLRDGGRLIRRLSEHEPIVAGRQPMLTNRELSGKRIGLIGFGHIAWHLVELLRPFHVHVTATDPYAPHELADALGVTFAPLEAVFARSDVVICLAPLTSATHRLITEAHLRLLSDGSVFVNVSRGAVVDPAGLAEVAAEGRTVFCLDVYDPEPIPVDDRIRDLPNVLLTPHIAGVTDESRKRFFALMVDELARHFDALEPRAQPTAGALAGRLVTPPTTPQREAKR
jgi:phosphoglycerate dehydrogenase-like enzyme